MGAICVFYATQPCYEGPAQNPWRPRRQQRQRTLFKISSAWPSVENSTKWLRSTPVRPTEGNSYNLYHKLAWPRRALPIWKDGSNMPATQSQGSINVLHMLDSLNEHLCCQSPLVICSSDITFINFLILWYMPTCTVEEPAPFPCQFNHGLSVCSDSRVSWYEIKELAEINSRPH